MKYRKKPIVVEAIQFTDDNCFECLAFMGLSHLIADDLNDTDTPMVRTLEGDMETSVGDWIIRGIKGEFYPCKPDIFAASYDPEIDSMVLAQNNLRAEIDDLVTNGIGTNHLKIHEAKK